MWVTSGANPSRDGSMDGDVIAHEYGHGVAERLLPNGLTNSISQSGSLGEGWSDSLSFLRWGDAVVGDYATSNTATGVRSVAYDTSTRSYGSYNTGVNSPHFNGEIWATMVYDVREALGLDTTTQLVIDGMRNTPNTPTPTFIDARDGILAADMTNNGGANRCAIWSAFASNGLGVNAVSNGLHAAQTNNFDMPPDCLPTADANGPYTTNEGIDITSTAAGRHPAPTRLRAASRPTTGISTTMGSSTTRPASPRRSARRPGWQFHRGAAGHRRVREHRRGLHDGDGRQRRAERDHRPDRGDRRSMASRPSPARSPTRGGRRRSRRRSTSMTAPGPSR